MKSKRGQGLPMNTIVIAAIVLIVMVVLIYIFVGGMSQTTTKLGSCAEKGGRCSASINCNELGDNWVSIGKAKSCEAESEEYDTETPYCCVPISKE